MDRAWSSWAPGLGGWKRWGTHHHRAHPSNLLFNIWLCNKGHDCERKDGSADYRPLHTRELLVGKIKTIQTIYNSGDANTGQGVTSPWTDWFNIIQMKRLLCLWHWDWDEGSDQATTDTFSLHTLAFVCERTHDDVPTHCRCVTALRCENNLEPLPVWNSLKMLLTSFWVTISRCWQMCRLKTVFVP